MAKTTATKRKVRTAEVHATPAIIEEDHPALLPDLVAETVIADVQSYLGRDYLPSVRLGIVDRLVETARAQYAAEGTVYRDMNSRRENACRDELRKWLEHWAMSEIKKIDRAGFDALQRCGFGWSLPAYEIRNRPRSA